MEAIRERTSPATCTWCKEGMQPGDAKPPRSVSFRGDDTLDFCSAECLAMWAVRDAFAYSYGRGYIDQRTLARLDAADQP